jgi:hypothetical protein
MARISRNIAIWAGVVLCAAFLAGVCAGPMAGAVERGREQSAEQVKDQYEDSRILVEAFVVEVKLETLYKAGVSPIGKKPNAISIDHILHCLGEADSAQVTSGAKVAVRHNEKGSIQQETTKRVRRITTSVTQPLPEGRRPPRRRQSQEFDNYTAALTFRAEARVLSQERVAVGYSFAQSDFDFSEPNMPPGTINRNWGGTVSLEPGRPSIVGSTQNPEKAAFLILCADIKNR